MSLKREFELILNHRVKITRRSGFTGTAMGQRRSSGETEIVASASVFFDMPKASYINNLQGDFVKADYLMLAMETEDIQPGDLIYPISGVVGMTMGRALEVKPSNDTNGLTHHIEVAVERVS